MMFKNLSDFKGEAAFDTIDKLLEPISRVSADKEFLQLFKDKASRMDIAHYIVRNHSEEITEILAILAEQELETFKESLTASKVLAGTVKLLNDEELMSLFQ